MSFLLKMKKKKNRKKAHIHGLQHCNTKEEILPARKTGPPCNCSEQCFEKVQS